MNLLFNRNIKYYDIAISNENSKKTFYLNNFFAPAGSSLGKVLKSDKKWNLSRGSLLCEVLGTYIREVLVSKFQKHKSIEFFLRILVGKRCFY